MRVPGPAGVRPLPPPAPPERVAREVAVGFPTRERPDAAARLLASVRALHPTLPVYVALQGDDHGLARHWAHDARTHLHRLPGNGGVAAARNLLCDVADRPFVLLLDDDMVITPETDLGTALALLDDPSVDIVGGRYAREIRTARDGRPVEAVPPRYEFRVHGIEGGALRLERLGRVHGPGYHDDLHRAYHADVVHNVALLRRELVAERGVRWDPAIPMMGEHHDFYLTLWSRRSCRVLYLPRLAIEHRPVRNVDYQRVRYRTEGSARLLHKWGFYLESHVGGRTRDFRCSPAFDDGKRWERLGLGARARPLTRILGARGGHLVRPHRAVHGARRVAREERFRRRFRREWGVRLARNVLVPDDLRWAWVASGKCSRRFLTDCLDRAEHGPPAVPREDLQHAHREHRLRTGRALPPRMLVDVLTSADVFRFGFVRNPFTRALAVWLEDFVAGGAAQPYVPAHAVAVELGLRRGRDLHPAELPFRDFLAYVAAQPRHTRDRHWSLLVVALWLDRLRYDVIGKLERLDEDLPRVLEGIGVTPPEGAVAPRCAGEEAGQLAEHYADGACVDLVRHIWAEDFRRLGYSTDPSEALAPGRTVMG